jgi:formylglycine-generating enzyme required for sulfatase activity
MDLYLVVDLKGGADATNYTVSYLVDEPKSGWTDEYKTDKLVLRRIEPGNFFMGSPHDGMVKKLGETRRKVTLNQAFYIGVFEVTQRQWELVMGNRPSFFSNSAYYATLPVEQVSYLDIRGSGDGANWPAYNNVDATSFMGKMRAQTGNAFDLPTEAQWEYAGRAGTLSSTASSTASIYESKGDKDKMAWYKDTASGKTHPVGQKKANAWGLYDMHGNVWDLCLDWHGTYPGTVTDPRGSSSGVVPRETGWVLGQWCQPLSVSVSVPRQPARRRRRRLPRQYPAIAR